jgi:hypothetical protein
MANSFSSRNQPTMGKQLINFIAYNLQSRVQTYAVLVKGLYELFGNPTT